MTSARGWRENPDKTARLSSLELDAGAPENSPEDVLLLYPLKFTFSENPQELLGLVSRGVHNMTQEERREALRAVEPDWEKPRELRVAPENLLGAGGMGKVYKYRDPFSGEEFAVKMLEPRNYKSADDHLLWLEAYFAAQAATHIPQNFARVGNIFVTSSGRLAVAYEFLSIGKERFALEQYVPFSRVIEDMSHALFFGDDEDQVYISAFLETLARAVDDLHSAAIEIQDPETGIIYREGLVHRDLKPENILLDFNDPEKPVVLDLGLAQPIGRQKSAAGTPGYVPPESFDPEISQEGNEDIFAFGAILFYLFTSVRPSLALNLYDVKDGKHVLKRAQYHMQMLTYTFESSSFATALNQKGKELRLSAQLMSDVRTFFSHALARDPQDRYQTTKSLVSDFIDLTGHIREFVSRPPAVSGHRDFQSPDTTPLDFP